MPSGQTWAKQEVSMNHAADRRTALQTFGVALAAGAVSVLSSRADAAVETNDQLPHGATALAELTKRLAAAPRRRDYKTVPMIANSQDQWDHEALSEIFAYKPATKQAWDNTDLAGGWLNVMRNSLNSQIWSFDHPNFLVVSATHGPAHLALYDQASWDKYGLAKIAGGSFEKNSLIIERTASADPKNYEDPEGMYSPEGNTIPTLQRRGVVFIACHNAIWEMGSKLHKAGVNPDKVSVDAIAADLTNHLIPGVVLSPGAVATLAQLQQNGFHYAR
jgi:intracellular sulfur oxidation DsrE/DsrF family protein